MVSGFIKENLPEILKVAIDLHPDEISEEEYIKIFEDAFLLCDDTLGSQDESTAKKKENETDIIDLDKKSSFDVKLSGSTVCTVYFEGTRIMCANAGDSRAIKVSIINNDSLLGESRIDDDYTLEAQALSEDHKPELEMEAKRIKEMGGRIDSFHDSQNNNEPVGPQRVWLKDQDMPGLAMSRSLGDQVAHSIGVSSLPEVKSALINVSDKFVVVGSDGVWEFLSNEDVANIVVPYFKQNQPEAAANAIVKAAHDRWVQEEEVVDDITAVVIFMEPLMAYEQPKFDQTE